MDDVGAAIFFAQAVVDRADVDDDLAARLAGVGGFEQRVGVQVGDDKPDAWVGQRATCSDWIVPSPQTLVDQREMLVGEAVPWCCVVDGQLRPATPSLSAGTSISDNLIFEGTPWR